MGRSGNRIKEMVLNLKGYILGQVLQVASFSWSELKLVWSLAEGRLSLAQLSPSFLVTCCCCRGTLLMDTIHLFFTFVTNYVPIMQMLAL